MASLSGKPPGGWAKQLSAKYSQKAGPSLVHELELGKGKVCYVVLLLSLVCSSLLIVFQ